MVTPQDVEHIAELANIPLRSQELSRFKEGLTSILGYMEQITHLKLRSSLENPRMTEEENILREDAVQPSLSQESALKNARKTHQGYFMVDGILEKGE